MAELSSLPLSFFVSWNKSTRSPTSWQWDLWVVSLVRASFHVCDEKAQGTELDHRAAAPSSPVSPWRRQKDK